MEEPASASPTGTRVNVHLDSQVFSCLFACCVVHWCDPYALFPDSRCKTNIDECTSDPCVNGATCQDGNNGYTCRCLPGFTGAHCDVDIDECGSMPCMHGGICQDEINRYELNYTLINMLIHCLILLSVSSLIDFPQIIWLLFDDTVWNINYCIPEL